VVYSRILIVPTTEEEFNNKSIEEVQEEYYVNTYPKRENQFFRYKKRGIKFDSSKKTLLLFRYKKHLIALAELVNVKKYEESDDGHFGEYHLKDIQVLNKPVTNDELENIWGKIKYLPGNKPELDISKFPDFLDLIKCRVNSIKPLIS
jgi:hypothetical protein